LQMWQTNIPMMVALLLALRHLDARPGLAGLLLGLAVNIKYLPLVYLPYLLLRRRFEAAAWFVVGIVVFAVLPSAATGWSANVQHWATALSGLARLLGFAALATEPANIDLITAGHSISITSGIARALGPESAPSVALVAAGVLAIAAALVLGGVYGFAGKPKLRWPRAIEQQAQPYLGMVALEWMALMSLTLAFSPQTNPRHTCLLLMAFAPLAAMLCVPRPNVARWPAWAATGILFFGLVLPPNTPEFASELARWRDLGGAGWCMLGMLPFFLFAGFTYLDARPARSAAAPLPASGSEPAARLSVDSA
jgi:Glycosyltransferase family 87